MKPELLHRGSVKDIYRVEENELLFQFSNRYSIFDWGEMPDSIPGKGRALAKMGCKLLTHLQKRGFPTHYIGPSVDEGGMRVKSVNVPRDDMTIYQKSPTQTLIPLEVIFRFGAPKGSSLLRRFKTEADWKDAGFDRAYREGEFFDEVKIDFTTKLERQDRILAEVEAKTLAGMNDEEWSDLQRKTLQIANEIKHVFAQIGAMMWDGKLEFAFAEQAGSRRNIMLVDSIGLDEMRLTFENSPLSKELLRQHYLSSTWYSALNRAKETQPTDFREYCQNVLHEEPKPLPSAVVTAISTLYETVAELILCEENRKSSLQAKLRESLHYLVKKS